jgi:type VII secretion protein EccB
MMTNTRDNLLAHRFMNRRVTAALLEGHADSDAEPLARLGAGTYAGIFVTIALLAVVGILGALNPVESTAWQEPGAFIVEKETGAGYVFLDGVLHPVLNYSSAKLLLGSRLQVMTVSVRSLASAPHGPAIGIPSAPDSLPDAGHIVGTTWSVCAIGNAADGPSYRTAVFPGQAAAGTAMGHDDVYLVRSTSGQYRLIWTGHAYPIPDQWLPALGYPPADAIAVDDAFVTALPAGQQIAPPEVPGLGQPGPTLPGSAEPTIVGSIYADRINTYYLMTQDGLVTLTPLQAQLLLADSRLAAAYGGGSPSPLPISQAQLTNTADIALPAIGTGEAAPTAAPELTTLPAGDQQLCIRYVDQQLPEIVLGPADRASTPATGLVQLPVGSGALVAARPNPDTPGTTVYLVTDSGSRYPVAGQRALEQLGLTGVTVAQLPGAAGRATARRRFAGPSGRGAAGLLSTPDGIRATSSPSWHRCGRIDTLSLI